MEHEIRTLRAHFWSDRDPDGRAFAPLAEAYLNRGDVEEALALVEDGLGRLPDYATGHLVAARVHRVRGDQAAVRDALEALLALDRGNAPGLRLFGEISEEAGEVQAAIDAFREALERDPGYADLEGRIARLGYPAPGDRAGGRAHSGDAGTDDPGGRSPDRVDSPERVERESPEPETLAEGSLESATPQSRPESRPPEALEHGHLDVDDEPFSRGSFEPFHADLEDLDGELEELESEPEAGAGPGPDSELDLESDAEFEAASKAESHPPPSEDLIFHPFDEPFEVPAEEDPFGEEEDPFGEQVDSGEPAPPLATRTMAELYVRQGFTDRGVEVYRQLVKRDPDDPELRRRLGELESAAGSEAAGEDPPVVDTPEASDSEANQNVSPPHGGEDDDPWGSAPQWTGEDPGTSATDRSPFGWVPDPEDPEAEALSEMREMNGEAIQDLQGGRGPSAGQYFQDLLAWEPGAVPIESLAPEADPGEGDGGEPERGSVSDKSGDDGGLGLSHSGGREG